MCVSFIPFMNSSKATLVLLKQKAGIASAPPPHWYELPIWPKKIWGFPVSIKPLMTKKLIIITLTKPYDHR